MKPLMCTFLLSAMMSSIGSVQASDLLLKGGYVMTMDPGLGDLEGTDVRIRDGRIVEIGKGLDPAGARLLSADGAIVLPGFIDTHSHLYVTTMRGQFRNADGPFFPVSSKAAAVMAPSDVGTAMHLGALELIEGGITTTADFFDNVLTPAHGQAGLRALETSGIRGTLYYGGPDKTTKRSIDLEQLGELAASRSANARVSIGLAWRLPRDRSDAQNWAMRQREYDAATTLGLPIQVHVSGEPGPMFDALIERSYLSPKLTVVHATDASADQLRAIELAGASLALTPLSEQRVGYGLTRLDHFAAVARQGLGIDGNALAGSGNMFETMRLAALTWSGQAQDEQAPGPRALLELATRRGADAIGLGKEVGTISVGKRADVQIIRLDSLNVGGFGGGDPSALLVYSARPSNVDTVIVDGQILKQDGRMTDPNLPRLLEEAAASARSLRERADQAE